MKRLLQTLRGAAALTGLSLATLVGFIPLLPVALIKLLAPWESVRRPATRAILWVARNWLRAANNASLVGISGTRVHYDQQLPDEPEARFVLISNHQCWADVMLLCYVLVPQLPFPRFFIKERLRWLPIVGLACWALDFPFMKRYSREQLKRNPGLRNRDMETVRRACAIFRDWPVTLINYAEGTRSTAAKRAAADSPYQTMLPPKAGGTAFAVNAMDGLLDGVLDMTVAYVNIPVPTFWDFVCGRVPDVAIRLRMLELPERMKHGDYSTDAAYRREFKAWLENLWAEKDAEVAAIQDPGRSQTGFAPAPAADERGVDMQHTAIKPQ